LKTIQLAAVGLHILTFKKQANQRLVTALLFLIGCLFHPVKQSGADGFPVEDFSFPQ